MGLFKSKEKAPDQNTSQFTISKVGQLVANGKGVPASDADLQELSKHLVTMKGRSEKSNIQAVVSKMFEEAVKKATNAEDKIMLSNLRQLLHVVEEDLLDVKPQKLDTIFFPDPKGVQRLVKYLSMAKNTLRICVFNITHDDLAKAIEDAHKRGVEVKIITDDECMNNLGSDIVNLAKAGIQVRTDSSKEAHMHNKFVVVDDEFVITGSFNWTQ